MTNGSTSGAMTTTKQRRTRSSACVRGFSRTLKRVRPDTVRLVVIDLHCHVIPGIDDGPETIEDSLALCEAARAAGTDTIVATSHVNWDYPTVDAVVIHTGLAHLNAAVGEAAIGLRLRPGAEMGLTRVADLSDAEVGVLRLGGGPLRAGRMPAPGRHGDRRSRTRCAHSRSAVT